MKKFIGSLDGLTEVNASTSPHFQDGQARNEYDNVNRVVNRKSSQIHHNTEFLEREKYSTDVSNRREPESLLTLQEVKKWLFISDSTMRRLIRNGAIPIVRIGGCVRINPDDVRRYIRRMTERVGNA